MASLFCLFKYRNLRTNQGLARLHFTGGSGVDYDPYGAVEQTEWRNG